jgi:hypothetical protein
MKLVEGERGEGRGKFKLTHYRQPRRRSLYAISGRIVGHPYRVLGQLIGEAHSPSGAPLVRRRRAWAVTEMANQEQVAGEGHHRVE